MFVQSIKFDFEISAIACVNSSFSQSLLQLFKSGVLLVDRLPEVADEVDVKLSCIRAQFCWTLQEFCNFVFFLLDPTFQFLRSNFEINSYEKCSEIWLM